MVENVTESTGSSPPTEAVAALLEPVPPQLPVAGETTQWTECSGEAVDPLSLY